LDISWEAATKYHDLKLTLGPNHAQIPKIRATAVRAVLARAKDVMGSSKKETRKRTDSIAHRPYAELNVDETLENIAVKPYPDASDIIVDYKEQKRLDCALMLDTSLSMSGEKLALLAVAATVLAYKLPAEDFALVAFESTANTLKKMCSKMSVEHIAQKILDVPALGYTNIESALVEGKLQLSHGKHKNRVGILISDGKYTAGGDPAPAAAGYRALHVVLIGDFNTDPEACRAMAATGHGHVYRAPNFQSLPRTLHRLLADLLA
jgi:Mg-chelatase subunit ChlD